MNPPKNINFGTFGITHEYGATVGWKFIAGRDFSKAFPTDSSGFVITASAAEIMELEQPIGATIQSDLGWHDGRQFRVLGVVEDLLYAISF